MTPGSRRRDRRAIWAACALIQTVPLAAFFATTAKADPIAPDVAVYAARNATPVCETIADYPTVAGVTGIVSAVMEDGGFTAYESGEVIALAVTAECPQYLPVLQRFIDFYSSGPSQTYATGAKVGGRIA